MYGEKITLEDLKYITQGLCRIGIGLQDAKIEFIGKEFVLKKELTNRDLLTCFTSLCLSFSLNHLITKPFSCAIRIKSPEDK